MEIVDVIDDQNIVIGVVDKDEAHRTGALHRCVIAELIDSAGNWTLVQQAADRQDAGRYVSPVGGHVKSEESEMAALIRETQEELSLSFTSSKRIGQAIYYREVNGKKENHLFIVYEIYADATPVVNHESVGFKKFSVSDLKKELSVHLEQFGEAFTFVISNFYPTWSSS